MTIETIGTWAGEVYKALEVSDTRMLGLKLIKKATKLKKDEIMAALGWLGREGKIVSRPACISSSTPRHLVAKPGSDGLCQPSLRSC